jgi:eukaryotic-like serine/threonine-protein kinase
VITSSGQRLGQRYVLHERLAVGGMGEVWSALDEQLNRLVAVKVLRTDLAPDAAFQARFRAEARTAAALSHGGIAAVFDYGESGGAAYLVMELVPGEPLSAMIAHEGALGTDRTLQIVSQAARALHAAHRHGVIHRDIKPANLMVTPELRVKVTDFGIARPRDHEPLTATGQVMGTAHYLAPELARGEIASPLSDVYALGVVAYECLAGWRPFDGDNQVAVATAHLQDEPPPLPMTVPAPVRAIVEQAMAKDPSKRPQGANVLAGIMEDARLRGLAARSGVRSEPVQPAWPTDAATPPRGHRPPPPPAAGTTRADRPAPFRPDSVHGFIDGVAGPPPGHARPPVEHPPARPARAAHGSPAGSARDASSRGPSARGNSSRGSSAHGRRLGPETSVIPASLRRPRGGRISVPLAALLVLIVLVVIGSLVARSRDSSLPAPGSTESVVRAAAPESGFGPLRSGMMTQHITTEGWNW